MRPEVLYDLAVIRLANGNRDGALEAVRRALELNPKLGAQARADNDLAAIRSALPES
jgi:Flp pilus assembly protein TadD